jgi:uncharacterized protein DUF4038/concanavalin A-like lectin/glucanase superfamily protein/uncharacterized protein DUF5060/collagenase-like protein with putative collagen-binding domain
MPVTQKAPITFLTLLMFLLLSVLPGGSGSAMADVIQWEPHELSFTATNTHDWDDFPIQVTFEHTASADTITLDGYWCGGNTWKVKYALTKTGNWTWLSFSGDSGLNGHSGSINCIVPSTSQIDGNPNYRGHLKVSGNGRYLEYTDGIPFFWLGDTVWNISCHRCGLGPEHGNTNNSNFYTYIEDRKSKKFTVIQVGFFALQYSNEGGLPFPGNLNTDFGCCTGSKGGNGDFSSLNPDFWYYADIQMREMWERGFVVAGHPNWMSEMVISLPDGMSIHRYIFSRYNAYNIVWSLSGEYPFSYGYPCHSTHPWCNFTPDDWNAIGVFVDSLNTYNHPLTAHPSCGEESTSERFHNSSWLDINWQQTRTKITLAAEIDYNKTVPVRPFINVESGYDGYSGHDSHFIIYAAWSMLLNGSIGYGYGANGLWNFHDSSYPTGQEGYDFYDALDWDEAIELPGSFRIAHIYDFFTSKDWYDFIPHRDWLRVDGSVPTVPAEEDLSTLHCSARPGEQYVILIPQGNEGKTIEILNLQNNRYRAKWFNPRTGVYSNIVNPPDNVSRWTIPSRPDSDDWVVYLERGNPADLNNDGLVNSFDLGLLVEDWLDCDAFIGSEEPDHERLIAHYKLDDGSDSVVLDSAGGNNGTIVGNPTWTAGAPDGLNPTGALDFPGGTHYVNCGNDPSLNITGSRTVAAWISVDNWSSLPNACWDAFVSKGDVEGNYDLMRYSTSDNMAFYVAGDSGSGGCRLTSQGNVNVKDGQWHHAAGVYDVSGVISLYIDGELDVSTSCEGGTLGTNAQHVRINGYDDPDDPDGDEKRHIDGRIDDVRIYDYALSDSEIRYLAGERIYVPLESPANLYDDEPMGSRKVNLADFAILAGEWLENTD